MSGYVDMKKFYLNPDDFDTGVTSILNSPTAKCNLHITLANMHTGFLAVPMNVYVKLRYTVEFSDLNEIGAS